MDPLLYDILRDRVGNYLGGEEKIFYDKDGRPTINKQGTRIQEQFYVQDRLKDFAPKVFVLKYNDNLFGEK